MSSPVSSLTASRSPSPEPPVVQPDHFYSAEDVHLPSPDSQGGKTHLTPDDDPLAHRGIPVFKPTMAEFADFEAYMNRVECWGRRSGIVKVIPPAEWTDALPDIKPQLANVKIKSPIEQFMRGRAGLFRQENVEKRKLMSVREWAELCKRDEFRAPGKDQVGVHNGAGAQPRQPSKRKRQPKGKEKEEVKEEPEPDVSMASPPNSPSPDPEDSKADNMEDKGTEDTKLEGGTEDRNSKARARRLARVSADTSFLSTFSPHTDWLPTSTAASDYTPSFCTKLERAFWRNCGLGKPAWYGADTMGSLFPSTSNPAAWNVAALPSTLSRLLPSGTGLPGVNTPYLYFGMWRATFAWHVEDMDLFSINYIHFGAPKFWYAVPQGRAGALEDTMRGYFPKDTSQCPQFLRHKSFLASPTLLAQSAVRPNHLVQHAGEFVITYPRGYHAGFNLGLNCAESVNFALDSWLDEGRKAGVCRCVDFSVRIDVDQLLEDRRIEALEKTDPAAAARARVLFVMGMPLRAKPTMKQPKFKDVFDSAGAAVKKSSESEGAKRSPRKRKPTAPFEFDTQPDAKRARTSSAQSASASSSKIKPITIAPRPSHPSSGTSQSYSHPGHSSSSSYPATQSNPATQPGQKLTLKLGPRPSPSESGDETFPCCLCVSSSSSNLFRVHDLPAAWRELAPAAARTLPRSLRDGTMGRKGVWMAHESCALVLPETWVDEIDGERVVFGVDGIVRGRWTLKCSACARARPKAHGALIQCAKGKCPKAFHVSCAQDGVRTNNGIAYTVIREVEKEVVLLEPAPAPSHISGGVDPNTLQGQEPNLHVLKTIRKTEVEALCAQHNPVIVASRRASKAEGLRADILALAPLSRIKVRMSAGVFEVTLVRVHEERRSVETSLPTTQVPDFTAATKFMADARPSAPSTPSYSTHRPVPDAASYWAAAVPRQNVITLPARPQANAAASTSSASSNQQQPHQSSPAPSHSPPQTQAQPQLQTLPLDTTAEAPVA
ncbi:Specific transcriptional repressor [Mycena venus]|uniref:[histone H3]-trimethyl-L-lysine(9) demethylase n=1 Tax=Mycena venus TaxID=2733690 RepID=A0A8H6X5I1_9AGAR|nr:Specific transcriptional repressor [Mycena venus]